MPESCEHFVFLVITSGDSPPTWDGSDNRTLFGPYVAREDGSHLPEIEEAARGWKRDHPDLPGMALYLFSTELTRFE